eukprot:m51a1_g9076 hypothetical protein (268) ;mRNA; f:1126-2208
MRHDEFVAEVCPALQPIPEVITSIEGLQHAIGALADCTSIPIPKPNIGFEVTKKFYDTHHGLYSAKVEVVVQVVPLYKVLFLSDLHNGGEADITVHCADDAALTYTDWLQMMANEEMAVYRSRSRHTRFWALLLDSGYAGEVKVVYPHVVLERPSEEQTVMERLVQRWYKRRQVFVKHFFGHMKKVFKLSAKLYVLDKGNMQQDIDNMIFLTNEHINELLVHAQAIKVKANKANKEKAIKVLKALKATHKMKQPSLNNVSSMTFFPS